MWQLSWVASSDIDIMVSCPLPRRLPRHNFFPQKFPSCCSYMCKVLATGCNHLYLFLVLSPLSRSVGVVYACQKPISISRYVSAQSYTIAKVKKIEILNIKFPLDLTIETLGLRLGMVVRYKDTEAVPVWLIRRL